MDERLVQFLARAEAFMARVEGSLPHGLEQPDWNASIAFRYRRRSSGQGVISAVRHVGSMALSDLKEIDAQKAVRAAQFERLSLAQARYQNGISSYLDVLDAERELFNAEQALVQSQLLRLTNTVDLYRSLGGGFTEPEKQ